MRLHQHPNLNQLVADFEQAILEGNTFYLDDNARQDLIHYYDCTRQYDWALEVLDFSIALQPFTVELLVQKANYLNDLQKYSLALQTVEQALNFSPKHYELLLLRVEILGALGNTDEAFVELDNLEEAPRPSLHADYLVTSAILSEQVMAFEKAYYLLKAALEIVPDHTQALERLGIIVEITKKYADSISFHQGILDKAPYTYQAWFNLGQAFVFSGRYQEAIEAYEYAFIIDPYFEIAIREYLDLCFELRLYDKVLHCYEDLKQNFILDTEDWLRIGQCYLDKTCYKESNQALQQALLVDPFNDEVYFYLGELMAEQEHWQSAISYYDKAISIEHTREEYYASRGETFFHLDRFFEAELDFKKAVDLAPEDGRYTIQYCSFLMQMQRSVEALYLLDEVAEQGDPELMYGRIACLFMLGRRKEGIYRLGEALIEDFEAHSILFELIPDLAGDRDVSSMIAGY